MKNKPNILFILTDDLGYSDLGCFGSEIKTPNLDQLAMNGVRFTQMYNSARCCPSRASLLTGLYPHQAGVGLMTEDRETPGYRGFLKDESVTLAEVLKTGGYKTYMSGKWHVGKQGPIKRGFDEFYGLLGGFTSFWDEKDYSRLPNDRPKRHYAEGEFYATDAITDYAIDFLEDARKDDRPYFLYLSYNAPHFPLQAPKDEIAKYEQVYEKGWDAIREERLARMKQLQIIEDELELTPRSEYWDRDREIQGTNPAWDSIDPDRKKDLVKRMAIYAAMVDRMDQNVGRVLENIREHGELDNTLIIFCSDNGACAEWDPWGFDNWITTSNFLHRKADLERMGGPDTYHSYGSAWANASSTPLRMYKHYGHEGGISTPMIAHWPEVIKRKGDIDHRPGHFIDFMATFVDITGIPYPTKFNGNDILSMEGESLLPAFHGEKPLSRTLCFEHEQHCAIRQDEWKLVKIKERDWELYNIEVDRTEMNNLANQYPDKVQELKKTWEQWAERTHVVPRTKVRA
ncbi:arylsulfatase [Lederbergia graminis]|uniref:Arylsulfatase n=1 Tax=Lederbergia graminis TaxID=735518 RepID=A0ABW0LFN4_9BACI|nr:arylsulfatase [Paenibacillus bovis]HLU21402.1 arylsulfatase [Bacillaceae bacterium]